ncbi:MAG: twin-arginine translocase TatA/TatE family subunit [Candidatus Kapaibacterium sp.]
MALAFLPSLGVPELLIIIAGLALLFGGKKIPELMKGIGSGIKEFKKASNEDETSGDKKKIEDNNTAK